MRSSVKRMTHSDGSSLFHIHQSKVRNLKLEAVSKLQIQVFLVAQSGRLCHQETMQRSHWAELLHKMSLNDDLSFEFVVILYDFVEEMWDVLTPSPSGRRAQQSYPSVFV